MLYRCLIFLRQTGLWEQMWETIRLNLNLNLNLNKNSLSFRGSIDEKKLSKYIKYCKLQQKTSVKIILYRLFKLQEIFQVIYLCQIVDIT